MKKTYISRNYKGINSAGSKAKMDTESILNTLNYKNISLKQATTDSKLKDFAINLVGIAKATICMPIGGILFLQYPIKKYYTFLCKVAHLKNTKVICLIHDLGSQRRKKLTIEKEIKRLNNTDYIIATNSKMELWLKEHNVKAKVGSLGVWHYLSPQVGSETLVTDKNHIYTVNYAGALNHRKNAFLYKISEYIKHYKLNLYGSGFDASSSTPNDHFAYKGFMNSDDFIASIDGDWGLVWDGDSLDEYAGNFGEYLQLNTPHKVSLYIRTHLPIIIGKQAALASFVEENKIGFTISSIHDIDKTLKDFDIQEYNTMKQNIIKMDKQVESGAHLKVALENAEKELSKQ